MVFQFFARPDGTRGTHFVSEPAEDILGISADTENFFERFLENIPNSHREACRRSVEEAIAAEAPWEFEVPFETPSGDWRWLLGRSIPRRQDEEVVFNGVLIDITDRKEGKRRLEAIFNHTYQLTGLMEPDGTLIEVNDTALQLGNLEKEDVLGQVIWETDWFQDGGGDIERLRAAVQRAATGEVVRYKAQVCGGGEDRIIDFSLRPIENEQGEVVLIIPEGRDITDRKAAERELRQSERRFRKVFENAAIGIVIANEEGCLLRANPAFQAMIGYDEEALCGRHFSSFTHPEDVEPDRDLLDELLCGARNRYQLDKRYVRNDGTIFWGRVTVSLLNEEGRYVALVEDIDEQKEYEAKLREAKDEAERAARLKSVMLANMSHEVRTPLTSMIGFSGILEEQLDGRLAKLARLIHKSGRRLEETLESVLQFSQLEADSYQIDRETVFLNDLVHCVVGEFESQARGVTIQVEKAESSLAAYADEVAVQRVVSNLLDNALKFTPEGEKVTIRVRADGNERAVVEVEDTGVGIGEEALPHIFDPFQQESEGITREYEGAGLGLSIVDKLVDVLGGQIEVDSEKGKGTRFVVYLPRPEEAGR